MKDFTKYSSIVIFILSSLLAMAVYYIQAEDEKMMLRAEAKMQVLRSSIDANTAKLDRLVNLLEKSITKS